MGTMSAAAFISQLSSVLILALGLAVLFQDSRAAMHRSFFRLALICAYEAFAEAGLQGAGDLAEAWRWMRLGVLWPLTVPAALHFVLLFSRGRPGFRRPPAVLLLYLPALGAILLYFLSGHPYGAPVSHSWGWSYRVVPQPANAALSWIPLYSAATLVIAVREVRRAADGQRRSQALSVLAGVSLPLAASLVTHGVLPFLGIGFPPATVAAYLLQGLLLGLAILRVRLFSLSSKGVVERIAATMSDALCLVDADGRISYANRRLLALLREEDGGLEGRPLSAVIRLGAEPGEAGAGPDGALLKTLAGRAGLAAELIDRSGRRLPGFLSLSRLDSLEGGSGYVALFTDLTSTRRIEEELRSSELRLKILFEHAPDAYYLADLQGVFVDGNQAAEQLVGHRREELIGRSFLQAGLLQPGDVPRAALLLAQSLAGRTTGPDEFILNHRSGGKVAVEIRTHPVRIGDRTLILGIARDISKRRDAERALYEMASYSEMNPSPSCRPTGTAPYYWRTRRPAPCSAGRT